MQIDVHAHGDAKQEFTEKYIVSFVIVNSAKVMHNRGVIALGKIVAKIPDR